MRKPRALTGCLALCGLLMSLAGCSGSPAQHDVQRPPTSPSPSQSNHAANPEDVPMGIVTGRLPLCTGALIRSDTNPLYRATLQVTSADGSVQLVRVSAHLRPDTFSIRLPVGTYRIHDNAAGWHLPNNQVAVHLDTVSHVDLGFMGCL